MQSKQEEFSNSSIRLDKIINPAHTDETSQKTIYPARQTELPLNSVEAKTLGDAYDSWSIDLESGDNYPQTTLTSDTDDSIDSEDLEEDEGGVQIAAQEGTLIDGALFFNEAAKVNGSLQGSVHSTSLFIIGQTAEVTAHLNVKSLIVHGNVRGDVYAAQSIRIEEGGCLIGDVVCENLSVENGAIFEGNCCLR